MIETRVTYTPGRTLSVLRDSPSTRNAILLTLDDGNCSDSVEHTRSSSRHHGRAFELLAKPIDVATLEAAIRRACVQLMQRRRPRLAT